MTERRWNNADPRDRAESANRREQSSLLQDYGFTVWSQGGTRRKTTVRKRGQVDVRGDAGDMAGEVGCDA